jgi:hypothetical protein
MSTQDQAKKFEDLKKANSPWFSLEDGESANVVLRSMKAMTKTDDKTGVVSAMMSIDFDVETDEGLKVKKWNTSSSKAIQLFIDKGIDVGSSFTLTKHGESFATTYDVSNVVNKVAPATASTATGTPPAQPAGNVAGSAVPPKA